MANGDRPGNPFRRVWLSVKLRVGRYFYDLNDVIERTSMSDSGEYQTHQMRLLHPLGCGCVGEVKALCRFGETLCKAHAGTCSLCSSSICLQTTMPDGPHSYNVNGKIVCRDCYRTLSLSQALESEEHLFLGVTDSIVKLFTKQNK